jgi:translocation and assembly module TamB
MGAGLAFKKVEFGLFPPSTSFKEVTLSFPHKNKFGANLTLQEFGVYFTYASLFSSKLEIDELELKRGSIKAEIDKDNTTPDIDWKKIDTKEIFAKYASIYSQLPVHVNVLRLTEVETQINNVTFSAHSISLTPHKTIVRAKMNITKFHIKKTEISFDSIKILAAFEKESWKLDELNVDDKNNSLNISATITSPRKYLEAKSLGKYNFNLDSLPSYFTGLPKNIADLKGQVTGNFTASGNIFDPNINTNIVAQSIQSTWINLEFLKLSLFKKKNIISVGAVEAKNKNETYKIKSTEALYDIHRNLFLNAKAEAELTNAETNTFLYTIRDSLEVFKGKITGKVVVGWDGRNVNFEIKEKTRLEDFALKVAGSNKDILSNKGFVVENGFVALEKAATVVAIDLNLTMLNSSLHAVGRIYKDQISIDVKNSLIDLKSLGPIAGVKLEGAGPVEMKIYGPMDDVRFDLDIFWKNFSVVDLHFGEIRSRFILSLKDLTLDIPTLDGHYNQSIYTAGGKLGFGKEPLMDINFNFKETTFKDAQQMYALVFRNMKNFPDTDLKFETKFHLTGGYDLPQLEIKGKIQGSELKIFDEEADFLSLDFSLRNEILNFEKIKIQKSRGEVYGNFKVDLHNNHMVLAGEGKGLKLSDFSHYRNAGLDYDAEMTLEFSGAGNAEKFPSKIKIKTTEAFIDNIAASPSVAEIVFHNNEIDSSLDILAGKIKANVIVGMESKQVKLNASIDSQDIRELLGVLSSHNMIDKSIIGKIKTKLQAEFNYASNKLNKLVLDVISFNLKKGDVDIKHVPSRNNVVLENGKIKQWDLQFTDGEDFFSSYGGNLPSGDVSLTQNFSIKASIFQLVSKHVDRANGKIKGSFQFDFGQGAKMNEFSLNSKNNSIKFKNMPGLITDLSYDVKKINDSFVIKQILGKYGEGEFKISGNAVFDNIFPKINLEYKVDRSTIPLFKRSSILVSGAGNLQGSKPPYRLNGKFQLLHGEFLDDPSEYSSDKKITLDEYRKYLPEKNQEETRSYIDYNLNIETTSSPVLVKNNMAEIYLKGAGLLTGNPLSPEVFGKVEAIPALSKFKFKGHEFIINQGFVEIKDTGKVRHSDLKFVGVSKINDYEMKIDISGKIEKLSINLSSEPALAQEDLLSLLTLGVTSDMSKNLEAGERKFVTTVGIGTLLVDQLKINEDLNSSLGLKLSVMPEFKEEVTSLVQGKSAVSDSSASRLKSSTKIKVNKQIGKQVDVSLSSTVGGSLEQKQEVNINYNFNKNLSLEGVYEVKPSEDTSTSTSTPNSVGADLKYRWSF